MPQTRTPALRGLSATAPYARLPLQPIFAALVWWVALSRPTAARTPDPSAD